MPPNILVPLDGSELAARALPYATTLARALSAQVTLLAVWRPVSGRALRFSGAPSVAEIERDTEATAEAAMHEAQATLQLPGEAAVIVRRGEPAHEIMAVARELDAKLIVMTTHGRTGVTRWRLGSVAGRVLHESATPLVAIGPAALSQQPGGVDFKHLLVALDGSAFGEAALPLARELSDTLAARVTLARTVASAFITYPFAPVALAMPAIDDELEAEARAYLETQAASIPGAETAVLHGTDPAARLCDALDERRVDLVVMATHARTAAGRAVLGSTADRLLQCRAPVALVRPRHEEAR